MTTIKRVEKLKPARYEVQTHCLCTGWGNCWTDTDKKGRERPTTFPSRKAAQAAILAHILDVKDAVRRKEMAKGSVPSIDDFRVVLASPTYKKDWAEFTGRT